MGTVGGLNLLGGLGAGAKAAHPAAAALAARFFTEKKTHADLAPIARPGSNPNEVNVNGNEPSDGPERGLNPAYFYPPWLPELNRGPLSRMGLAGPGSVGVAATPTAAGHETLQKRHPLHGRR